MTESAGCALSSPGKAVSLSALLARATAHEGLAVATDARTRRGAQIGTAVLVGCTALAWLVATGGVPLPNNRPGFYIVGWHLLTYLITAGGHASAAAAADSGALLAAISVCIATRGFRSGSARLQTAIFGCVLAGGLASLPALAAGVITLLDLGLWLALLALCVAAGLLLVWILFAALAG